MAALTDAEQLLIWSLRRWSLGGEHAVAVWTEYATRLGTGRGRQALAAFSRFHRALRDTAGRRIALHAPCCPCLEPDARTITAMAAAAQAGEGDALAFLALDLGARIDGLAVEILLFAGTWGRLGLTLPWRPEWLVPANAASVREGAHVH